MRGEQLALRVGITREGLDRQRGLEIRREDGAGHSERAGERQECRGRRRPSPQRRRASRAGAAGHRSSPSRRRWGAPRASTPGCRVVRPPESGTPRRADHPPRGQRPRSRGAGRRRAAAEDQDTVRAGVGCGRGTTCRSAGLTDRPSRRGRGRPGEPLRTPMRSATRSSSSSVSPSPVLPATTTAATPADTIRTACSAVAATSMAPASSKIVASATPTPEKIGTGRVTCPFCL